MSVCLASGQNVSGGAGIVAPSGRDKPHHRVPEQADVGTQLIPNLLADQVRVANRKCWVDADLDIAVNLVT